MVRKTGRPPHNDVLTPAEWRIVNYVRHGLTNPQIATLRGISLDAVKYHVANAIGKLQLDNRKALKQWSGVPRDSYLNRGSHAMNSTHTPRSAYAGVGQISRTVSDIDKSETWYRDVLGLTHLYSFGDLAFFDCGGTRLMLSAAQDCQQHESLIYLQVFDIGQAREDLAAAGVEFLSAAHRVHTHENGVEEWMAFFNDPDGRPLALMSQVGPSAKDGFF